MLHLPSASDRDVGSPTCIKAASTAASKQWKPYTDRSFQSVGSSRAASTFSKWLSASKSLFGAVVTPNPLRGSRP